MRLLARSAMTLNPSFSASSRSVLLMTVNCAWPCCIMIMRKLVAPTTRRLTSRSGSSPILLRPRRMAKSAEVAAEWFAPTLPLIFDRLDRWCGDQIVGQVDFKPHDHHSIGAAHSGACDRRSGAGDHLKL